VQFETRDLIKQPLSQAEIRALGKRVKDIRELVKPINQKEVEGMSSAEIVRYLAENPNSVRRPIIDAGETFTLGFTPQVRKQLDDALGA